MACLWLSPMSRIRWQIKKVFYSVNSRVIFIGTTTEAKKSAAQIAKEEKELKDKKKDMKDLLDCFRNEVI